jgi:hypothetical protein
MIRIPLTTSSSPGTALTASGLRLPVPFGAIGTSGRPAEVLRAVAAAAALADPTGTSQKVKDTRNPDTAVEAVDDDDLKPVLDAVVRVQADRTGAAGDSRQQEVASSVGVDSRLVVAAQQVMQANAEALEASQNWVAAIDLPLLERAAVAAHRRSDLIPGQQAQSQRLNEQVTALKTRVDGVATAVDEIKAAINTLADEVRQAGASINDRIDQLDTRVGQIDERVKKLEAPTGSQPPP